MAGPLDVSNLAGTRFGRRQLPVADLVRCAEPLDVRRLHTVRRKPTGQSVTAPVVASTPSSKERSDQPVTHLRQAPAGGAIPSLYVRSSLP